MEQLMYSLLDESRSEEDWLNEKSDEENVLENSAKLVKGWLPSQLVALNLLADITLILRAPATMSASPGLGFGKTPPLNTLKRILKTKLSK